LVEWSVKPWQPHPGDSPGTLAWKTSVAIISPIWVGPLALVEGANIEVSHFVEMLQGRGMLAEMEEGLRQPLGISPIWRMTANSNTPSQSDSGPRSQGNVEPQSTSAENSEFSEAEDQPVQLPAITLYSEDALRRMDRAETLRWIDQRLGGSQGEDLLGWIDSRSAELGADDVEFGASSDAVSPAGGDFYNLGNYASQLNVDWSAIAPPSSTGASGGDYGGGDYGPDSAINNAFIESTVYGSGLDAGEDPSPPEAKLASGRNLFNLLVLKYNGQHHTHLVFNVSADPLGYVPSSAWAHRR
jgi:hypothetical protein